MSGESPGRRSVKTCRCKCGESQFVFTCCDIFYNFFQTFKIGDIRNFISCLFQQSFVCDQTKCFVAVTDRIYFSVFTFQVEVIGSHLFVYICITQIQTVVFPCFQTLLITALEQCRSTALAHLSSQCVFIVTGCCGNNLYIYTCLLCIGSSQTLPCLISFRFEVQVIYFTAGSSFPISCILFCSITFCCCVIFCLALGSASCEHTYGHHTCQRQSQPTFCISHFFFLLFSCHIFITVPVHHFSCSSRSVYIHSTQNKKSWNINIL